jgi:hypothetical protein
VKAFRAANSQAGQGGNDMTTRIFLALLATLAACSQNHPIGAVGRDASGSPQTTDATSVEAGRARKDTAASMAVDTGPLGPVESWTGWFENFRISSGSDVIKLSFASDPNGVVVGKVTFGATAAPPAATDPNLGYPDESNTGLRDLVEGFPFTMYTASITPNRLRFAVRRYEPWTGWCAIQAPPFADDGSCLPPWGSTVLSPVGNNCTATYMTGAASTLDCGRFQLCGGHVCACSATSCTVNESEGSDDPAYPDTHPAPTSSIDLLLTGNIATGSMKSDGVSPVTVHFTKDP